VEEAKQRTLVIIKPDAVQRQFVAMKLSRLTRQLAEQQYAPHRGKHFYEPLLRFMTGGPVVLMVLEGKDAVAVVRCLMGPTFGPDAPPGTIRGDFGMSKRFNLVHGSDTPDSAEREIALFFRPEELVEYNLVGFNWIYDTSTGEVV